MINIQSILSAFNEKGTLLQWLKKVCDALEKSVLNSVTTMQPSIDTVKFTFRFNDGTKIETPPVVLPEGQAGTNGVSIDDIQIASRSGPGVTTYFLTFKFSDQSTQTVHFSVEDGQQGPQGERGPQGIPGAQGEQGPAGNGIVTVHALRHYEQDNETITVIEAVTDDGTNPQFEVHAQNGAAAPTTAYITINSPPTATSGVLLEEDLTTLQASKDNKIIFDNEIYSLQDNQHESGFLIYTHIGHSSTNTFFTKCITITISTRGWVLTTLEQQKQLYLHAMHGTDNATSPNPVFILYVTERKEKFNNINELEQHISYYYNDTPILLMTCMQTLSSGARKLNLLSLNISDDHLYYMSPGTGTLSTLYISTISSDDVLIWK